ncbi:anti-phage-associated DUF1156 domain-containing protein [Pyxidicoccus sp. 3LFB2]
MSGVATRGAGSRLGEDFARKSEANASAIVPFAWKDRPALIERAFPAQKVSIEAQTERKAGAGQTLTALGSYWKGRKPLVLVRACVLGSLLPATDDPEKDLEIFELLMAMDDAAFEARLKSVSKEDVAKWGGALADELLDGTGGWKVRGKEKHALLGKVLTRMPYSERLNRRTLRPEELDDAVYDGIWDRVNAHLCTCAKSHVELVEQLGILRFGRRPRVADTFSGGGSIPFEAARIGCDAYASDLNPIACMLTWGAFNIIGADELLRKEIASAQEKVVAAVDAEITSLGIEHDEAGNRAKAYLYCLEVRCPETGWMVPLAPSWVISKNKRCIAKLIADEKTKRFEIEIVSGVSDRQLQKASVGTAQQGDLVYELNGKTHRTPLSTLRGDRRVDGGTVNDLRRWDKSDIGPMPSDIFQERLYCIQWTRKDASTFFASVTPRDHEREAEVNRLVKTNLANWQAEGLVPEMAIDPGDKTDEPVRTRGWTHWHHLFTPRHLHAYALARRAINALPSPVTQAAMATVFCNALDRGSKLSRWRVGHAGKAGVAPAGDYPEQVFYNQALNTLANYAARSFASLSDTFTSRFEGAAKLAGNTQIKTSACDAIEEVSDLFIADPPYADAVSYHEITEYFIAWLRKAPPEPFREWVWDSRRDLAIKGEGDDFRQAMIKAYAAMAEKMPDNGLQIVMFTHRDAAVWGDMAGIFWGAGLKVTAAWYIATETTSELKKGGYVQGTVVLILRKRLGSDKAYKDELALEIRDEVARQIETMVGLNQTIRGHGRSENLYEDADLQMAGYAAALRVLTSYTHIDATDMTREALRPSVKGVQTLVDELIGFAVTIANEHLVPEGLDPKLWEKLLGSERFYLRMLDVEAAGGKKLDNYQNFAKAFRVASWMSLMASVRPNEAALKSATDFKRSEFQGSEFASSPLRAVLYALYELQKDVEPDEVISHLRDHVPGWFDKRPIVVGLASFLAAKLEQRRPEEASAARVLDGLIRNERVGG